ncbi:MAG TPA: stage III sporulation protein AE [Clostridiales bacterium]|nr:stage III sporulation protein AE [Clostridiales bacterium]
MKKSLLTMSICLLMGVLMATATMAADVAGEQRDSFGVDRVESALPGEAAEILDGLGVEDSLDVDSGLQKLLSYAREKLGGIIRRAVKSGALMVTVVLLCSMAGSVYDSGAVPNFVPLGGALAISAMAAGDISSFIGMGKETLQTLSDFSKMLLPSLCAAATASGAITAGAAKYAATALFMDILMTAATNIVLPVIYCYIATVIANAAVGGNSLAGAANLMKWLCTSLMTVLVIAFTAYLSLTEIISGSTDVVSTRIAKTTLSTTLPVVGSIISDAASTVVAGASILRNAIGVFGLLAVAGVCLTPFLTLGAQYLIYKAAAGMAGALSDSRLSGLISSIGGAFGMVLSLTGVGALMLFFSIISSIRAVSGL